MSKRDLKNVNIVNKDRTHVDDRNPLPVSNGAIIPVEYTGLIGPFAQTGTAYALNSDASIVELALHTAATGELWGAFGVSEADALANVDATSGSEAGWLYTTAGGGSGGGGGANRPMLIRAIGIPESMTHIALAEQGATRTAVLSMLQGK